VTAPVAHPPGVSIRLATDADVASLAVLRRVWAEEQTGSSIDDPHFADAFSVWWDKERHQRLTWVATTGDVTVGMLNLLVYSRMPKPGRLASRWGYIANAYVSVEYRDGGVGGALLDAATAYADEHGFVRLVLSPSPQSVPLYVRAGFDPATSLLLRPFP